MILNKNDILNKKMINPHLLILGDNQTVLKDLKATYEETVDLIHIIGVIILNFIKTTKNIVNGYKLCKPQYLN